MRRLVYASLGVFFLIGCGEDNKECKIGAPDACDNGQVCEAYTDMSGMHTACFAPTVLRGKITNAESGVPIPGARVVAIDGDSHASTGPVSISDSAGNYSVRIIAPRAADASKQYTLRVSAAGYNEFPSGIRIAIPITVSFAMPKDAAKVEGPQDVALTPIAAAPPGAIAGKVSGLQVAGVLVVAEAAGKGWSTVSD
ncbi:MAG TPA: carboxypeptidase-like regulatory domain-containing protein, partial [Polyangia bacterium]|nr:carboxypeptidase-like regulatory domain-containing protein [Polyangia bacterium]